MAEKVNRITTNACHGIKDQTDNIGIGVEHCLGQLWAFFSPENNFSPRKKTPRSPKIELKNVPRAKNVLGVVASNKVVTEMF